MQYWFVVGVILLIGGAAGSANAEPRGLAMWYAYKMQRHAHQMQKQLEASIDRVFAEKTADAWAADLGHADPAVRARAIVGLANERDRRMIAPLARELQMLAEAPQNDPISSSKGDDIQRAFEKMGAGAIFETMMPLAKASNLLLAAAAAMPDPGYVPPLERLLARDRHNEMIRDALAASRNLSASMTAGAAPDAAGSQDAIRFDDPAVLGDLERLRAAQATASPDDLLRGLFATSAGTSLFVARAAILYECARRPERAMAEAAGRWAAADDPKRRIIAAMALGGQPPGASPWENMRGMSDEARVILRKLTEDPVAEVAMAGLRAILARAFADKDEIKPLRAGRHPDASIRTLYVGHAYGIPDWFDGDKDVDALLGFLGDPSLAVRTEAATRISHILGSEDHRDAFDRADVRAALGAIARDDTASLLLQTRAISILATLNDKDAAALIEAALAKVDNLSSDTIDELSPLHDAIELKPNVRYVPGLQRYARKLTELGAEEGVLEDLIAACRDARKQRNAPSYFR